MPDPTPDEPRRTPTREGIAYARGAVADAREQTEDALRALAAARPAPEHVQAAARAADAAVTAAGGLPAVLAYAALHVCPPGRHRPDDDPTPGDRCKDCGQDLTWRGPGPHDWDVAEPAPIGYLVVEPSPVPSEPPRANWDGEIHPTRERADAECAQANGAGSGPRERPDYWWRVVAVVELDALAPADPEDEPDDGGPLLEDFDGAPYPDDVQRAHRLALSGVRQFGPVREYAIIQGGQVASIVMTSAPMDAEHRARYRGDVVPVEDVPAATLEAYRYWGERP